MSEFRTYYVTILQINNDGFIFNKIIGAAS